MRALGGPHWSAHRCRLGVNHEVLPVDRPRSEVNSHHRDGAMHFDGNSGGQPNYEPNGLGGPAQNPA